MRIAFIHSDKQRERILGSAFVDGAKAHGDDAFLLRKTADMDVVADADIICLVGVKSREIVHAHWRAGIHTIYLDKGYCRGRGAGPIAWEYWRVAVNAHHPTRYLATWKMPSDRWDRLGIHVKPWRTEGGHILIAGSSAKYHAFYGLADPTRWTYKLARLIANTTDREIVYRPKPSWKEAVPIWGTTFDFKRQSIDAALKDCWAVVTHGSNAVFEALLRGIPTIVLGDAVTRPISSTDIDDINEPRLASEEERLQLLAGLAYTQWTLGEMASGQMWAVTRPLIYA